MNPQVNTTIRMIVTLVLIAGGTIAPHYVTAANVLTVLASATAILLGLLALSNLFHVPGKVVKVLQTLVAAVDTAKTAIPAPAMAAAKKIAGRAAVILVILLPLGALAGVASSTSACNASSAQVQTTIADGAKVGACILGQVLSGNIDPASLILQCSGATEQLIVDVIDDFKAQHATDAGAIAGIASDQARWLESAKQNAIAALSRKGPGK